MTLKTPPESVTRLPLTPPPTQPKSAVPPVVQRIITEVRNCKDGHNFFTEPWTRFELDVNEYEYLQRVFQEDGYWIDKLRYDYFPSIKLFVLRMPTTIHETVNAKVVREIQNQLKSIADGGGPSAEFAGDIEYGGSESITFPDGYGKHDPDGSFHHPIPQYPGVIIEVSYTQKRKDLARLADDYILGSTGEIRVVIGLDISYEGKMATLSVWRPLFQTNDSGEEELRAEQTVTDEIFRHEDGEPNLDPEAGLHLQLQDFATEALVEEYGDLHDPIFIPSTALCAYLDKGEHRASRVKQQKGRVTHRKPGLIKRPRESTPPEEIQPDREAIIPSG